MGNAKSNIDKNISIGSPKNSKSQKALPIYKVYEGNKIPVSNSIGKLHESKINSSRAKRESKGLIEAWNQSIKYYKNDQSGHRNSDNPDTAGNRSVASEVNNTFSETENVVFGNVNSIVPTLYAKNPTIEVTEESESGLGTLLERLVNKLFEMKHAPGVNLKPKAKQAVVLSTLTNIAWFEVGYIKKKESSDEALLELQKLAEEYAKAKGTKELREIEGKLYAMELKIDLLKPSGTTLKMHQPENVLIDSVAKLADGSDGNWIAIRDYIQTDVLKAIYYKQDEGSNDVSIFEPSHLASPTNSSKGISQEQIDINNFTIFAGSNEDAAYKAHGYQDEYSYKKSQYTEVWKFWDKITRRVYLYNAKNFAWPIWVWNDPFQLEGFFPLTALVGYTDPVDAESKGEVTYYLDQQDAINEMNDHERRLRNTAGKKFIYNKNIMNQEEANKYLSVKNDEAVGLDLETDVDLSKAMMSPVPESIKYLNVLFDPSKKFAAIDRITPYNQILRNSEFKTNTTNQAIETYQSGLATRLDERIDGIEDAIGNVGWQLVQLCLMNMSKEEVSAVVGYDVTNVWKNLTSAEITQQINMRVVGGSTAKPTSNAKRQEAVQVGQALGQFANAAPQVVLVMLKLMEQSFEGINIKEEDWTQIIDGINRQQERGGVNQGQQAVDNNNNSQAVDTAVQQAIQQGIPEEQARSMIEAKLNQQ